MCRIDTWPEAGVRCLDPRDDVIVTEGERTMYTYTQKLVLMKEMHLP